MMKLLKVLIVPLWVITLVAVACMKKAAGELPHPEMHYTYLHNMEIKANEYSHVDIDGNGTPDFTFHTQLVGDPIAKHDRRQFLVGSKVETNLLNNHVDESPRLHKGDKIKLSHDGYNWFEISSIVLAEKVIPADGDIYWRGIWKDANHHYLPVQIIKNEKVFLGWIEISFDTANQKLILHKAAICKESEREIKAGY